MVDSHGKNISIRASDFVFTVVVFRANLYSGYSSPRSIYSPQYPMFSSICSWHAIITENKKSHVLWLSISQPPDLRTAALRCLFYFFTRGYVHESHLKMLLWFGNFSEFVISWSEESNRMPVFLNFMNKISNLFWSFYIYILNKKTSQFWVSLNYFIEAVWP